MATRIYVGNLPYSADNQQLTDLFGAFGEVVEASVVMDRDTGQSKGFGFVQMATDDAARNAIQSLNGTMLGNRTIRVNEAQPRPERGSGGGGYRSGSGGGYNRESQGGYRSGGYNDRPQRDDFGGRNYSAHDRAVVRQLRHGRRRQRQLQPPRQGPRARSGPPRARLLGHARPHV